MRYNFDEIKMKEVIKCDCLGCRKKKSKTITMCQTVSPFNKNADGSVKTREEVYKSVSESLTKIIEGWKNNFYCKSCWGELDFEARNDIWQEIIKG